MENYFNKELKSIKNKLKQLKNNKKDINEALEEFDVNPENKIAILKDKVSKRDKKIKKLQKLEEEMEKKKEEIKDLKVKEKLEKIKERIKKLESKRDELEKSSNRYERKIETAELLEDRKNKLKKIKNQLKKTKKEKNEIKNKLETISSSFSREEFDEVTKKTEKLRDKVVSYKRDIQNQKNRLNELEKEINELKKLVKEKKEKENKLEEVSDLLDFFEFSRSTLKEAAPHIAQAFVDRITKEADRYYKKITDDYSQNLRWSKEYEIFIKKSGREKTFNQLSGGEKMAAAISVRLSLLKTISESKIVFLDEPTENMDEIRREKLAKQIQGIDGFNQIFVISHDDTFNSVIENVTEIEKENGVSKVKKMGV